jgi:hypothetical protein
MLQQALFIVLFISSQILSINGLETFYEWMEKNSYICERLLFYKLIRSF